jgi:hypothetical protein
MKCRDVLIIFVATWFGGWARAADLTGANELMDAGRWPEIVAMCEKLVAENPDDAHVWLALARAHHGNQDLDAAIEAGRRAAMFPAVRAVASYNLACAYSLIGERDRALEALGAAKRAGFANRELMATDPDLEPVRKDPRFRLPLPRHFHVLELEGGRQLPIAVDLPVDYHPIGIYPVLIVPGDAEPEEGRGGSLFWGEDSAQRGWVVIESPALQDDDPVGTTAQLLDSVEQKFRIEGEKFHIAGSGTSGAAAFEVALALPSRFHTVSGLPGYPREASDEDLRRLKDVRVNFFAGDRDRDWLRPSRNADKRLRQLGIDSHFEIVAGGGHILEELSGGEFMDRLDAQRVSSPPESKEGVR